MPAFQSILTALGWSLMGSIWQMAAVWTAYYCLTAYNRRISSAGKHDLAFMFVAIASGWFVYSFIHVLNEPAIPVISGFIPVTETISRRIPYLSLVYLVILTVRFIQYGYQCYVQNKNRSGKCISPVLQCFAERHAKLMGITRSVHVYLSELAETAVTGGFFKPWILLPVTLVTRLSPQQLESILMHELFHIRRNDYLINIIMSLFQSIFFFNPFAHLFFKAIARERELACDDGVLEREYAPALYAEALYSLEKFRQPKPGLFIAADGNKPWLLMERIRRVLGKPELRKNQFNPVLFFGLVAALALFGLQQKKSKFTTRAELTVNRIQARPLRFELAREKINVMAHEILARPSVRRKAAGKRMVKQMDTLINEELPEEESTPLNQAYFAENNVVRDYSNQQTAALNQDPIQVVPGTPYVPSRSLSYEALPDIIAVDSIRDIVILNRINNRVTISRMKQMADLEKVETEMEKNRQNLVQIETENQKLILMDQKNIRPLLNQIHLQIKIKKKQIDQLRIRLQDSEKEIIHI
jgi:beta-lactamase regulating signal transducer with metallopeptidase domain